jgi:hypothetical protein
MLHLLSDSTAELSLNSRPLWKSTYRTVFARAELSPYSESWWARPLEVEEQELSEHWRVGIFAPVFSNTINSKLPYGGNNGAAWYGKGLTTELQGGAYLTSKYLTATLRPHIYYTGNRDFRTPRFIPTDRDGNPRYRAIIPLIDMPFRFGPDSYSDFNLGETSLRIHYSSIEAGVSNEPLWWGPGIQNALLLSNNAPGLRHAFVGTRTPVEIPLGIGDLEFKLLWAEPEDSEYFRGSASTNRRRFTTALNVTFSPGFAPNFSLGFGRFSHKYLPENGLSFSDFGATLPFINDRQTSSGGDDENQLVSAFFRWVFPEGGAEVYGEYLREDSYFNIRDLFMEPEHDRAFTVGFQKVVEGGGFFELYKFNGELSSLVPGRIDEVRPQTYYYGNDTITQGHTNEGQLLGAAIGPGSAGQYLSVDGYFDKGQIGFFIQRVAENDYFHYEYYSRPAFPGNGPKDIYRHRINLNLGLNGRYKVGPLLLSGRLVMNNNYNYGRFDYGQLDGINFDTIAKNDIVNMQFRLSAQYFFE